MAVRDFLLLLMSFFMWTGATAADHQDLSQITAAVESYIGNQYAQTDSPIARDVKISVKPLDTRLRFSQCDRPLALNLLRLPMEGGQITVKVQCQSPQPWSIYVSATVDVFTDIVVASRALSRNTLLADTNVTKARRNLRTTGSGYYFDPKLVYGHILRRNAKPGDPIRASSLTKPKAIKRGDNVKIIAKSGNFSVYSAGEALSSGRIGDQIRVINQASERVIRARIIGPGQVEVLL